MPGFADSFWSGDYGSGLNILFQKLEQGIHENRQVLMIARMRCEAEDTYGTRLADIAPTADKITGGFARDDGATVKKAYDGVRTEMEEASKNHRKIAQSIRDLVVTPFSRWCDAHESRVQLAQEELQGRIKAHDRLLESTKKIRATYFNKCRLVEDIEEENKLAFQDPETSPKAIIPAIPGIPEIKVSANKEVEDDDVPLEIGDETYTPEQVKKVLADMLATVKLGETRVPILGTYPNTSAGSEIVEYVQQHLGSTSVSYAERIGQDLVGYGFLRLVGNVGNSFANSSKMFYQWRPKAFKTAGVPEKKLVSRSLSMPLSGADSSIDSISSVGEYLANWNPLGSGSNANESPAQRLHREAFEADEKYKAAVRQLDRTRCELEEAIVTRLRFMERCELDRLKAIKTVFLDFSGTIGNVIPSLQSTIDKMLLFQETIQPVNDLRYLLENSRTGSFIPKVVVYENYYNKVDEQIFGVDLEARARADKKRVPIVVTSVLTYLDHHYPDLEGDEARRAVWLADVPLAQTHKLRARVADSKTCTPEMFAEFDVSTVASLLKLYLLELPDSLVSSHVYEIIRTIYTTPGADTTDTTRINVLQQTLSQLRISNIATLDACMNHFTRLIELTSADEPYVVALATALAPCVLRPRTETSLTMEERHAYRLVRDLFARKDAIFSELKRMSTLGPSNSVGSAGGSGSSAGVPQRPRQVSTDESHRKAHVEERNRALLEKASGSRGRAPSPQPGPRSPLIGSGSGGSGGMPVSMPPGTSHRRDRSIGGPETRFPVHASTLVSTPNHRTSMPTFPALFAPHRRSLEVPGDDANLSPLSSPDHSASHHLANGPVAADDSPPSPHHPQPHTVDAAAGVEKSNSLSRSGARFASGRRVAAPSRDATVDAAPHRAVTLEDRPMDD